MVRIVGILCGSALAISTLIIALGVPEFLPGPKQTPEIVLETSVEESTETAIANLPDASPETDIEPVTEVAPIAEIEDIEPVPEDTPESIVESPPTPKEATEHWYAFWSPFRSELAANGFVSQLQRNTGMDYRVVRIKPGIYEVAFAYEADADIATHLAAISAATGLDLPDG
jgi:hypothetical protein